MFDASFTRLALSAVGALFFTITAVGAAVGPARLAETSPAVFASAASVSGGAAHV